MRLPLSHMDGQMVLEQFTKIQGSQKERFRR